MKKQTVVYVCSTLAVLAVVVVANYVCYHTAVQQFSKQQEQMQTELTGMVEQKVAKQVENRIEEMQEELPAAAQEDKVTIDTVYQIENYDVTRDQTTTEYETIPEELIGSDREETENYFKKYMNNLPVEEFLDGLQSAGVTGFSSERVIVRKVYDSSKVTYRYYVIAIDGEVVVYYGDQKTVYEYTGILTDTLSEEEQTALKNGIEVKDEDALFGLLENYSS